MHRRGRDDVGALDQFGADLAHPAREHRQAVTPEATLQIKDQPARVIVISQRRTGAIVDRRFARTGAANALRARLLLQWETAMEAGGAREEIEFGPQGRLDDAGAIDDGVRTRRPDQV